jgi:hypothetical protein
LIKDPLDLFRKINYNRYIKKIKSEESKIMKISINPNILSMNYLSKNNLELESLEDKYMHISGSSMDIHNLIEDHILDDYLISDDIYDQNFNELLGL